jgi:hypothetical protein
MSLIASESSSAPRTLAPAGTHVARCVQLVDLGTQDDTYLGEPKISHKVRITWELPYELHVFDKEKGEQPFFLSKKYTLSLGEQATLRKDLESWRGRQFTEEELRGFDLKNILGAACQITVLHKTSKTSGKVREEVSAVTPLAKGMNAPQAISELLSYDVDEGRSDNYRKLPKFLQEDIAKCHEWRQMEENETNSEPPPKEDEEDNIPF